MTLIKTLPLLSLLLLLCNCATMNRSECLNADWQMIGLEDGSRGRNLAYIGKHRKACADHNISPDLELYRSGHSQGLQRYCTYDKGLQLGQGGNNFRDICPPQLEELFRFGHQRGREIYGLSQEIKRTKSSINSTSKLLSKLDEELLHKEERIIRSKTKEAERALLLVEVIEIRYEMSELEEELDFFQEEKAALVQERNMLKRDYSEGPGY